MIYWWRLFMSLLLAQPWWNGINGNSRVGFTCKSLSNPTCSLLLQNSQSSEHAWKPNNHSCGTGFRQHRYQEMQRSCRRRPSKNECKESEISWTFYICLLWLMKGNLAESEIFGEYNRDDKDWRILYVEYSALVRSNKLVEKLCRSMPRNMETNCCIT